MSRTKQKYLTDQLAAQISELAEKGIPQAQIPALIGVSRRVFANWLRQGKEDESGESLEAQILHSIHRGAAKAAERYLEKLEAHASSANGASACTWFLTHHPLLRDTWSDAAATRREVQRTMNEVVAAIEATPGLPPEQREAVLLSLAARGIGGTPDQ